MNCESIDNITETQTFEDNCEECFEKIYEVFHSINVRREVNPNYHELTTALNILKNSRQDIDNKENSVINNLNTIEKLLMKNIRYLDKKTLQFIGKELEIIDFIIICKKISY